MKYEWNWANYFNTLHTLKVAHTKMMQQQQFLYT